MIISVGSISIYEWSSFSVSDLHVMNAFVRNLCLVSKPILWEYRREAATTQLKEFGHTY